MENQKDKKKKKVLMPFGLRNKLMAAISMLLVSSIMLVSSTYAWFTLSTAPEVKGISTSVGANGNLEMALLTSGDADLNNGENTFADLSKITSAVGDSSAATNNLGKSNLTWGNLVDLSYENATTNKNYYGLDQIKLMPARLNNGTGDAFDSTKLVLANPLSTPTYGNDGRVNDLSGKTYFSADYGTEGFKYVAGKDTYGVRAVGESATLSPQQKGLMAAKISYDANMTLAQRTMQESLAENMQELANAMLALAMGKGLESEQTAAIDKLLVAMETALDKIDMAYGDVARAYIASQVEDASKYDTLAVAVAGKTYSQIAGMTLDGVTLPTGTDNALAAAVGELNNQKQSLKDAKDAVAGETKDYATAMKKLVNTDEVKLNGLKLVKDADHIDETVWKKNADTGALEIDVGKLGGTLSDYNGGIVVEMMDGSGLFAYIGKVAGNYSASDKIEVIFGEFKFTKNADGTGGIQATLKTNAAPDTTVKTGYLGNLSAANATNTTNYITDTYGYIIDLAVRTNATNSNLLLASDGVQRVYNDGKVTNQETMGAGSTMTFKAVKDKDNNDVLSEAQVSELMKTIRVVFFNPDNGTIYGIAAIDSVAGSDEGYTGKLVLKKYEINTTTGVMTLTAKEDGTDVEKATLMALQQNTATKISVLVYLDGDMVDNSMVANAAQSITGSLNLQFKSDATLVPMENSALRNGTK